MNQIAPFIEKGIPRKCRVGGRKEFFLCVRHEEDANEMSTSHSRQIYGENGKSWSNAKNDTDNEQSDKPDRLT